MAVKLTTLDPVTVVVGGTPYPLFPSDLRVVSLTVVADAANVGNVYIGDQSVSASNGTPLGPQDSALIETPVRPSGNEEFLVNEVYVTSSTSGNKVRVVAWKRRPS